ncbi:RibD family protein [Agaribacter flavus]|uniref:RibD family protein n=1 Tax=Agaribacter flavus TaxID=1902781 RepID=A0ABV7FMA0_9ALTE
MDTFEPYWTQILALKAACKNLPEDINIIGFSERSIAFFDHKTQFTHIDRFEVVLSKQPIKQLRREPIVVFNNKLFLYFLKDFDHALQAHLQLYLPLATVKMHHRQSSFVITHMAQSLDGKVCTMCGASKWIGNTENLRHAHRVRALVDGVIVGGNTARNEAPSLNVRHVNGPNPARIILCNSSSSLQALPNIAGMRNFLLCKEDCVDGIDHKSIPVANLKTVAYSGANKQQSIENALAKLREENIGSILLEGGPTTIKAFMQSQSISWLQLHIAPLIFGSGHSFVSLPEIETVDQAIKLENVLYTQMGNAMVVTGQLHNV